LRYGSYMIAIKAKNAFGQSQALKKEFAKPASSTSI
jgi:hypothetical protein